MRKYKAVYVIMLFEADWQSQHEVRQHIEVIEASSATAASCKAEDAQFKKEVLRKLYPAFHDKLSLDQIVTVSVYRDNLADVWVCVEQVY
jgi:hypothetical protein